MIRANIILLAVLMLLITGCSENNTATSDDKADVSNPAVSADNTLKGEEIRNVSNEYKSYAHVTANNTVMDVINHPAFEGFGRFALPTDGGIRNENMKLNNIGSLLPYHSNIISDTTVRVINHMIDEAGDGKTIFYDFYTEQRKQRDASKESTGLFFSWGEPGAPFAVVCPGGGFAYVGSIHEGFPYALEISKKGYNAFVLKYRVGGEQIATEDLAAAISYIFENAETLGVGTKDYSLWGSSAGARMAANIGTDGVSGYGGNDLPKPSTIVMAYTGHSVYSKGDPPAFAVVGERYGIASPSTMEQRINALRSAGIDVEYHKYPNVGHGFGLGIGTDAEGWIEDAIRFWEKHNSQ